MKVVIIIPTYNERDNTAKMIDTLAGIVPHIPKHQVEVLYVDDSSPDGTGDLVREKQKKYKWLHLLGDSQKQGLGVAYSRGMAYAMKELKADYLMEFDSDFQHPPQDIPRLIEQIDNGYDYILASRYVPGGSVPSTWTFDRKAVSSVGNLIARVGLLIPQVHDCTGGFKLSRVKGFMDEFDFSTLYSKKFAYKIHLLAYMVVTKHAKVKEVPFSFASRTAGVSKYMTNEIKESLKVIFLFQLHNPMIQKFFKFGVVGGFGFIVNIVGAKIFKSLLITPESNLSFINGVSNALAAELSIISNFTWNNIWTFAKEKITSPAQLAQKFVTFNLSSVISGIVIPSLVIAGLTAGFGDHLFIYQVIAIFGLTIPLNWFIYNNFIWKKNKSAIKTAPNR